MKQSNDVFFLTLIDFLIQTFFFGLLLYVLVKASAANEIRERKQQTASMEILLQKLGVSSITELTDELTKLAPLKQLQGMSEFIQSTENVDEARKAAELIRQAGGAEKFIQETEQDRQAAQLVNTAGGTTALNEKLAKLKKLEEGSGKPPCLYTEVGDRKNVKPLATVIATDGNISFNESNPELEEVLKMIGRPFQSVRSLSLEEFASAFSPITQKKPDCRYTLRFIEKTSLVHARDAARFAFYLNISKN
jgi:hypothetical protein